MASKKKEVRFDVEGADHKRLKAKAKEEGTSIAALCRRAVLLSIKDGV